MSWLFNTFGSNKNSRHDDAIPEITPEFIERHVDKDTYHTNMIPEITPEFIESVTNRNVYHTNMIPEITPEFMETHNNLNTYHINFNSSISEEFFEKNYILTMGWSKQVRSLSKVRNRQRDLALPNRSKLNSTIRQQEFIKLYYSSKSYGGQNNKRQTLLMFSK